MVKFHFNLNNGPLPLQFSFTNDAPKFRFNMSGIRSLHTFLLGNLFMEKLPAFSFGSQELHIRGGISMARSITAKLESISFTSRYAGIIRDSLLGELDPKELAQLDPTVLEAAMTTALPLTVVKDVVINGLMDCDGLLLMDADGQYITTTELEGL